MIIGVDEVNFSPSLAGDCVVCAYAAKRRVPGVTDSKQLTHMQRLQLFTGLQQSGHYAVAPATVNDINDLGIYVARNLAMVQAGGSLLRKLYQLGIRDEVDHFVLDGYFSKKWLAVFSNEWLGFDVEGIIDGDQTIYELGAASIVARIFADALFEGWGKFWPGYRLEKNHGSPDPRMYEKLRESGPTPVHRTKYGRGWWEKIMGKQRARQMRAKAISVG